MNSIHQRPIDRILSCLESVKGNSDSWTAKCPAHEDKRNSLSVGVGQDEKVILKCHAGCTTEAIVNAIGLVMTDLFPVREPPSERSGKVVATYGYTDANGRLLYQVQRFSPKSFRQRRPDGMGGWIYDLKGVKRVLYRLPDIGKRAEQGQWIVVVEGEKDVENLLRIGVHATTNSGGAAKWDDTYAKALTGAKVAILPDNDEPGRQHAGRIALSLLGKATEIKIVELPGLPQKGDVSNWLEADGTAEQLVALVNNALSFNPEDTANFSRFLSPQTIKTNKTPEINGSDGFVGSEDEDNGNSSPTFDEPMGKLEPDLLPVEKLDPEMLPASLRGWLYDAARLMSCPLEFVAIPAIIALGSVIGRQIGIRPKRRDDWTEYPNLWGAIVGSPGALKSPAISRALEPLQRLEALSRESHERELENWQAEALIRKADADRAKQRLKKGGGSPEDRRALAIEALGGDREEDKPTRRRYIVNDATVEKLGELLRDNPNGLLQYRDELPGFLKSLEKQGHESDRAFYLEAWSGKGGFTYDRIGRGEVYIPTVCVSMVGTIQPAPLLRYIRNSFADGDDGFIARFQLLIWPETTTYRLVDEWADPELKAAAISVFERLASLPLDELGAEIEHTYGHSSQASETEGQCASDKSAKRYLHFDDAAQELFYSWLEDLARRMERGEDGPQIEVHLSKFRKLVPALALIFHLVEGSCGPVSLDALELAIRWAQFLESHAYRVYQAMRDGDPAGAETLNERLKNSLPNPFKLRDVYLKGWAGLSTPEDAERAVAYLQARGRVKVVEEPAGPKGGRPTKLIYVHPDLCRSNTEVASVRPDTDASVSDVLEETLI